MYAERALTWFLGLSNFMRLYGFVETDMQFLSLAPERHDRPGAKAWLRRIR